MKEIKQNAIRKEKEMNQQINKEKNKIHEKKLIKKIFKERTKTHQPVMKNYLNYLLYKIENPKK